MQHFSKVLQYDDLTIDGVTRKFTATKERLQNMLSTLESSISKEAQGLGDDLCYKGERLKVPRGYSDKRSVVNAVTTLMKSIITNAISALQVRFSSFDSNECLKATAVFSPTTWPSDPTALAKFGYDQIHLLSTHVSQALVERGYTHESCIKEWPELKLRV